MCEILYANEKRSDYENFYALCPYCEYENIFNRVSDLESIEPITYRQVQCQNTECRHDFKVNGDLANAAFEMLIYDCYDLYRKKKYSYCILNLAQSCEVFFSLYIYITLAYKPFNREENSTNELNRLISKIYEETKKYSYIKMQNIILNLLVEDIHPSNIENSLEIINNISNYASQPSRNKIEGIEDEELKTMLLELMDVNISSLRNKVVHKFAYRPSEKEASDSIEEIRRIILNLSRKLEIVGDDANVYIQNTH